MPAHSQIAPRAESSATTSNEQRGSVSVSPLAGLSVGSSAGGWIKSFRLRLVALAGAAVIFSAFLALGGGLRTVETVLTPTVAAMSSTVGRRLAEPLTVAIDAGIPFDRLVGVDDFLRTATAFDERIGFAALTDASGRVVASSGADADMLPAAFDITGDAGSLQTLSHYLATPIPLVRVGAAEEPVVVGHLLVGVSLRTPTSNLLLLVLQLLLSTIALLLLVREIVIAIIHQGVEAPARALMELGAAVADGDLSLQAEPPSFGPLRKLLEAARFRLAATNRNYHDLLLAAFAARSGHYEAPVLREIANTVDSGLSRIRLAPATGAVPLRSADGTASRSALFALLLGEALLVPAWAALPVVSGFDPVLVLLVLAGPLLLGLPVGALAARRLLAGSADTLAFTSGALIAAAAMIGLSAAQESFELVFLRVAGGVGLGIAIEAIMRRQPVGTALPAAAIVGLGLGLPILSLLGPLGVSALGAFVTAGAGVLAGQILPARDEDPKAESPRSGHEMLLVCGLSAAIVAAITASGFGTGDPNGPGSALEGLAAVAALAGAMVLGVTANARRSTAFALAAALLLAGYASLPLLENIVGVASLPFNPMPIAVVALALAGAATLAQTGGRSVESLTLAALVGLAVAGTLALLAGAPTAAGFAATLLALSTLIRRTP